MLINSVSDGCLMYTGSNLIFNMASIVNVFMFSIEKPEPLKGVKAGSLWNKVQWSGYRSNRYIRNFLFIR